MSYVFINGTHVHHYFIGLNILTGHHNLLVVAIHGIFNGLFIEGCSRWSMALNWKIDYESLNDDLKDTWFGKLLKSNNELNIN